MAYPQVLVGAVNYKMLYDAKAVLHNMLCSSGCKFGLHFPFSYFSSPFYTSVMRMLEQIKKRNGHIVPFERTKIEHAILSAFQEVMGSVEREMVIGMTDRVIQKLAAEFGESRTPSVEDVQNVVENVLMQVGYFNVARAYIIYRYEHTKQREEKKQEVIKKIEEEGLMITKRSGAKERFSFEKLRRSLGFFLHGIEGDVDADMIARQCRAELYDDIETREIEKALLLATRSFIERDPAYSKLASRLLLDSLFKDIVRRDSVDHGRRDEQYRQAFPEMIKQAVLLGRLDARMLVFNMDQICAAIVPERDDLLEYMGSQVLYDRYFLHNPETKAVMEMPQMFWMRVAMGLAIKEERREERAIEFYNMLSTLRYVASTPTLFHAGTSHPQLSSCYLTTVEDDLEHIFKSYGDNSQLSKWSGGIGNDWTNLRATGALIRKTGVESQGVIPFLKIANDVTVAINRSGKRRGATCAYLETWHLDIEDFLELRRNTGDERRRTHDMDIANWIPDLFMKRVREDGPWTLFSPDETPDLHHLYGRAFDEAYMRYEQKAASGAMRLHKVIKAQALWRKMISMLFETGHPWITWKDPSNIRSPQDHCGVVHSSNLCTEITLNTSADETAVCNLGSVNLAVHITDGQLDLVKLEETTQSAMRMLDNVIDLNFYPTKEALNSNMRHRPVGLGIMGFQDALYQLGISFDSQEAVEFADRSMEIVSYHAIKTSSLLAGERGAYASFRGSKWDRGILPLDTMDILEKERGEAIPVSRRSTLDWDAIRRLIKEHGMRNSNCLAIAPTATISNIADCTPSIEPIYKNIYVKSNMSGEFVVVNTYLITALKQRGLWNEDMLNAIKSTDGDLSRIPGIPDDIRRCYKEVFDIDAMHLVNITAHRGKWIDQSQSFNLFYRGNSGKELANIYLYAWELGLKTTYYLRTMAASSVEKSTVELAIKSTSPQTTTPAQTSPLPTPLPLRETAPMASASSKAPVADLSPTPFTNEPTSTIASSVSDIPVKLCRLLDPTCEACQ